MNPSTPIGMAVFGFVAAAISVVVFHQGMILIMWIIGWVPNFPWSFQPNPRSGVPQLINNMFWGGLYGIVFAFLLRYVPPMPTWLKGILLAVVINWFIMNQIVIPLLRGLPTFGGIGRPHVGGLISAAFGLGWILIYDFLRQRFAKA